MNCNHGQSSSFPEAFGVVCFDPVEWAGHHLSPSQDWTTVLVRCLSYPATVPCWIVCSVHIVQGFHSIPDPDPELPLDWGIATCSHHMLTSMLTGHLLLLLHSLCVCVRACMRGCVRACMWFHTHSHHWEWMITRYKGFSGEKFAPCAFKGSVARAPPNTYMKHGWFTVYAAYTLQAYIVALEHWTVCFFMNWN